jgi:ABC-type transporter Mla maintaining outer membrane lipid asymmetry ATPase subunit MlaF
MLEVREITKEYNRRAVVDHVSFTIERIGQEHDGPHADRLIGSDVGRSVVWRTSDPGTLDRV